MKVLKWAVVLLMAVLGLMAGASALVFGNGFHVLLGRDRANQRRRSHFVVDTSKRLHPGCNHSTAAFDPRIGIGLGA